MTRFLPLLPCLFSPGHTNPLTPAPDDRSLSKFASIFLSVIVFCPFPAEFRHKNKCVQHSQLISRLQRLPGTSLCLTWTRYVASSLPMRSRCTSEAACSVRDPRFYNLPTMTSNTLEQNGAYDFSPTSDIAPPRPSATTSPPARDPHIAARLGHLREALTAERHHHGRESAERALALLDSEILHASARQAANDDQYPRPTSILESQRRVYDDSLSPDPENVSINHTTSLMRPRRTGTRPSERLERHRQRLNQSLGQSVSRSRSDGNYSGNGIASPSSGVRDRLIPRIGSPDIALQEYSGEAQVNRENRWRAKRRKIDSDDLSSNLRESSYGHRGQVVSGPLKMEIVSCDGGQYQDLDGETSWPGNVLQDDMSVYCTKSDRCNIIIRHQKGIPFSLRKLVIKAPENGFDAPIQEGMIFVSSDDNDLLSRTAQYQITYSARRDHPIRRNEFSQIRLQPSHEYFGETRPPLLPVNLSTYLQNPFDPLRQSRNSSVAAMTTDFIAEDSNEQDEAGVPQQVPGFRVMTRFDDLDSDSDEFYTREQASRHGSGQGQSRHGTADPWGDWFSQELYDQDDSSSASDGEGPSNLNDSPSSPESDDQDTVERALANAMEAGREAEREVERRAERAIMDEALRRSYPPGMGPWRGSRRRRAAPSRINITPAPVSQATDGIENGNGNEDSDTGKAAPEVLAPHARFFIRRDKSCVTVRFDPPV